MLLGNEIRFSKGINSPEESYWFGFLVGDGAIYENRYRLKLALQKGDKKHLEKFAKFLSYSTDRIHLYGSMCQFQIDNKQLLTNLYKLGLCQNKIHKTHKRLIPKRYKKDFARGLFDADGTIHLIVPKNRKTKSAEFHIAGTKSLLEGIREVLVKNIKSIDENRGCIFTSPGQPSRLQYKGRWIIDKIGHYLFDKAEIYLERKYKIFQNLFKYNKKHPRQKSKFEKNIICKIKRLYKITDMTQIEIADKFDVTQSFISRIINNKRYQKYAI